MSRYTIWEILNGETIVLSCHTMTRTIVAWNGSLTFNWYQETAPGEFACIDVATVGEVPASFEEARQHAIDIDEARAEEEAS